MRLTRLTSLFVGMAVTVCSGSAAAAESLELVLPGQGDPGVLLQLQLPALSDSGDGLELSIERNETESVMSQPVGSLAVALPGLDGLNASSSAGGSPLSGLNPALSRALRAESGNRTLSHVTGKLSEPLPGLGDHAATALPGLDGLPVDMTVQ